MSRNKLNVYYEENQEKNLIETFIDRTRELRDMLAMLDGHGDVIDHLEGVWLCYGTCLRGCEVLPDSVYIDLWVKSLIAFEAYELDGAGRFRQAADLLVAMYRDEERWDRTNELRVVKLIDAAEISTKYITWNCLSTAVLHYKNAVAYELSTRKPKNLTN